MSEPLVVVACGLTSAAPQPTPAPPTEDASAGRGPAKRMRFAVSTVPAQTAPAMSAPAPQPALAIVLAHPGGDRDALAPTVVDMFGRPLAARVVSDDAAHVRIEATFAASPDGAPEPDPEADPPAYLLSVGPERERRSVWLAPDRAPATRRPEGAEPDAPPGLEAIGYTVRDYAGLRAMMQARIAQNLRADAAWALEHLADPMTTLVEVLAYAGDHLAFRQDAAGTEAYLETARRRTSLRRHGRLRDYAVDDGCNARTALCFTMERDAVLPAGLAVVTAQPGRFGVVLADDGFLASGTTQYETMAALRAATALNDLGPTLSGTVAATLPTGTYRATLACAIEDLGPAFRPGRLLVLRQRLPPTGADPFGARALRLLTVAATKLPDGTAATRIEWHPEDALDRPLLIPPAGATGAVELLGNVVLADHGRTVPVEPAPAAVPAAGPYRPRIAVPDVVHACPAPTIAAGFDPEAGVDLVSAALLVPSARASLAPDPRDAVPALRVSAGGRTWHAARDLLVAPAGACLFAAMPEDGTDRLSLSFGDGALGRAPTPGLAVSGLARIGGGVSGQVRADSLVQVLAPGDPIASADPLPIARVTNPLPAIPALAETDAAIRLFAATGFRAQARGVKPEDWERIARADPLVASATARAADTGGGPCRIGLATLPEADAVLAILHGRLLDHAVLGAPPTVVSAQDTPLDIALAVTCRPEADPAAVRRDLARRLGPGRLPDGRPAYFAPSAWPPGRDVVLADLVAAAARAPGVVGVTADPALDLRVRFQCVDAPETTAANVAAGRIDLGPEQRARIADDPVHPEAGRLVIHVIAAP